MHLARTLQALLCATIPQDGLDEEDAYRLFAAMLDAGVPELELGALLVALSQRPVRLPELLGFHRALAERTSTLRRPPSDLRPVVLPSYGATRHHPNLLPLLALLLQRMGVPVLIHGPLEGGGGGSSVRVLRELGVLPCANLSQAQGALERRGVAYVPLAALNPGLAALLSLRARLGAPTIADTMARLLSPFGGEGLRVVGARSAAEREVLRDFLLGSGAVGLLLDGTEGEPFANPDRRPRLEYIHDGEALLLFETELAPVRPAGPSLKEDGGPAVAAWTRQALAGEVPIPLPIAHQAACCLFGAGLAPDMNQAKAIVAVETHHLASA